MKIPLLHTVPFIDKHILSTFLEIIIPIDLTQICPNTKLNRFYNMINILIGIKIVMSKAMYGLFLFNSCIK